MTDIPKTKYGVAIALFREDNVFLSQRLLNQLRYASAWQIVYGFTGGNYERYADAAVRIVKEETGIVLTADRLCYIKSMLVGNEFYYTYFVHLKDNEMPADPDDEQSRIRSCFISFPLERAVNMNLVPCLEKLLRNAFKALGKSRAEKCSSQSLVERANEQTSWSCMCDYD